MSLENLLYTESHEWIEPTGEVRRVGISDHAQHLLGDIVYVELPKPGEQVKKGDPIMIVESPKAAADVYAPVTGEIVEVNNVLEAEPGTVNSGPYAEGWLFKIRPTDPGELNDMLDYDKYQKLVEG